MKGPVHISFDLTRNCNFKCLHCYNNSGTSCNDEMTDLEVRDLINEIAEIKPSNFCFCGGEPLLRADLLIDMAKILSGRGILCSFVTNGYLLTKELAIRIREVGIDNIQLSLDGDEEAHDRLRNKKGAYRSVIRALDILQSVGIRCGLAFSPTSWGIDKLQHVYLIANKYNCFEIRVQELMPLGRCYVNSDIIPTDMQYRTLRRDIRTKEQKYYLKESKVKVIWGDPIDHIMCFTSQNIENNFLAIRSNGDITVSMYIPVIVGNIKKYSLQNYWNNGLEEVWKNERILKLAENYTSVRNMNPTNYGMPNIFLEPDIYIDIFSGGSI